ncbi:OmpH family outer membrane protein [Agaribacter marinus]|uniref:Outer membrane protein n=1 Tax=Agaribacter marinus TaxID=1431249 RepID=A0AA37SWD1_9ALTE|nr:OmpH family outer membrane protein [Agaribacter marinus]GLR70827.1 outer membrane protein [Agaribacter marinus]
MKTLNKGLAFFALVGFSVMSVAANAAEKIAVVNMQLIIQSLPQVAAVEQAINEEFKDQRQELQKLQSDGNFMMEKLQREAATMSEDEKVKLQTQIQELSQQLQQKGQPLQQSIQRRTNEERQKLIILIRQAIASIAEAEGYDLIVDASAVSFAKPEYDISSKILDQVSKAN